jgi:hypothetical protein
VSRFAAAAAATLVLALAGACSDGNDNSEPSSAPTAGSTSTSATDEPTPTAGSVSDPPATPDPAGPVTEPVVPPPPVVAPTPTTSGTAPSPTATTTVGRRPGAVRGLRVLRQLDGRVLLAWQAPRGGTPATGYRLAWPGGGRTLPATSTATWASGLDNGVPTSLAVWALNEHGAGPRRNVVAEAAGRPDVPLLDEPIVADAAGGTVKHVTVAWVAVAPNGPGPVEYFVEAAGGRTICGGSGWTTGTSCSDTLPNDGSTTSYTVRARNAEATSGRSAPTPFTSAASAPRTVEAAAPPEGVSMLRAVATGVGGQARVTFDVGSSHGRENVIHCMPSCGNLASVQVSTTGASDVSFLLGGLVDGNVSTIMVWTCNGSSGSAQTGASCSASTTDPATTFGPLGTPTVDAHVQGACFEWRVRGDANGKPAMLVILAQGFTQSWTITGSATRVGSYCPGFGQTRTFTVRIEDSSATAEQPLDRGSRQASTTALTTTAP